MDFASIMSAQISKSSTNLPAAKSPPPASTSEPPRKYLKRSELEAERQRAYAASQAALEQSRVEKAARKRQAEEEDAQRERERADKRRRLAEESARLREEEEREDERVRRKRLGLPDLPEKGESGETPTPEGEEDVEDGELVQKLRELGEPARLFGESHAQRLRRYRKLTGLENDGEGKKLVVYSDGPIPTTLAPVPEKDMKVPTTIPADADGRRYLFRQLASYFTMVLSAWERALAARTAEVKGSFQGKTAYNAMVQTRENMKPLFKKMEKEELEDGILEPVVSIVRAAQERRYVDANDGYLTLSIGKAAWPIGVTMVGIHERSAREKLHEGDKGAAHIMGDEVTRKFLQSIKRCLSFAQTRWPPDDHLQLMG